LVTTSLRCGGFGGRSGFILAQFDKRQNYAPVDKNEFKMLTRIACPKGRENGKMETIR